MILFAKLTGSMRKAVEMDSYVAVSPKPGPSNFGDFVNGGISHPSRLPQKTLRPLRCVALA
eukprot:6173472-Pleurochrysis_carterae.AAC.2